MHIHMYVYMSVSGIQTPMACDDAVVDGVGERDNLSNDNDNDTNPNASNRDHSN